MGAAPVLGIGMVGLGWSTITAAAGVGLGSLGWMVGGTIIISGLSFIFNPAGAAMLFGMAGAGLTNWKMSKRWGDLEEFAFETIADETDTIETQLQLSSEALKLLDDALIES